MFPRLRSETFRSLLTESRVNIALFPAFFSYARPPARPNSRRRVQRASLNEPATFVYFLKGAVNGSLRKLVIRTINKRILVVEIARMFFICVRKEVKGEREREREGKEKRGRDEVEIDE